MFNIFKKEKKIVAPVSGKLMKLSDVKDEVLRKLKTEGVREPLEVKEEGSSYKIVKGGEIFDGIVKLNKEKMWDRYRPIPVKVVG